MRMDAYCMKCKTKRDVNNPQETVNEKRIRIVKGTCAVCGTKVAKILGKAK